MDVPCKIMAAMTNDARGIGYKGNLPWPYLKGDYNYMWETIRTTTKPENKTISILGRVSWEGAPEELKADPKILYIIMSNTLRECPKYCKRIANSFREALKCCKELSNDFQVDHVWILGGENIYEESLASQSCEKVYLTRIFAEFPCDRYFPKFEDSFSLIRDRTSSHEENGIPYTFEVYQRK